MDGRDAAFSPDGKRLAFARWAYDRSNPDYHGNPLPASTTWVRTLADKKETKLAVKGVPVGWAGDGAVLLNDGTAVDPVKGTKVEGVPVAPARVDLAAVAWTRDGKRLAYAPDTMVGPLPPDGIERAIYLVEAGGEPKPMPLGNDVRSDQTVVLVWAPDGSRLFFNLVVFVDGHLPVRRMGTIDLDGTVHVAGEMAEENGIPGIHSDRAFMRKAAGSTGPHYGTGVWDAKGALFTYVHGTGNGDADVYVSTADAGDVARVTDDGETKWSPSIDPAGRRVAFLVFASGNLTASEKTRMRVLDLLTGEASDYPLAVTEGYVSALTWSADGARVLYETGSTASSKLFAQAVPAAKAAPEGATIRRIDTSVLGQVKKALASGKADRISWAVEVAPAEWNDEMVPDFRKALHEWAAKENGRPASEILRLIDRQNVRLAIPEIREATRAKADYVQSQAIRMLADWDVGEAVPDLEERRAKAPGKAVRVHAAGALVKLGVAAAFDDVAAATKDAEKEVRSAAVSELKNLREARGVDLLIALVADMAVLYTSHGGEHTIADEAEWALATMTAKTFANDPVKWAAWWKDEAKGVLPDVPSSNEATDELKRILDEREEAYQEKMKKALKGFLPPK